MVRMQSLAGVTGNRTGPVYFRESPIVFGGGRDFGCDRLEPYDRVEEDEFDPLDEVGLTDVGLV